MSPPPERSVLDEIPVSLTLLVGFLALAMACGVVSPSPERLDLFGAMDAGRVAHGEPWRLLSYAFLHGGLLHIVMNTAMFMMIAPALERSLGSLRFATLFVVTALGGSIASILWHASPQNSVVGASGALFGMIGAQVAIQIRAGRHAMEFLSSAAGRRAMVVILILLAFGFLMPRVSNSAHIGGLVAGFVCTLLLLVPPRYPRDAIGKAAVAGWIALYLSLLGWCVFPATRWDALYGRLEGNQDDRPVLEALIRTSLRNPTAEIEFDAIPTTELLDAVPGQYRRIWSEITSPIGPDER